MYYNRAMSKKNAKKRYKLLRRIKSILFNPLTYAILAFPFIMIPMIIIVYHYEAGVSMEGMGDSFWNFLIAFVAGYYDICVVTPIGRLCSFIILIAGILVFSTLTGKIASVFMEAQMKKDKGLAKLKNLSQHFIICGYKNDFEKILESVLATNEDLTPDQIVLINEAPSENMENLRSDIRFKGIHYVAGDFSDETTLKRAKIEEAERTLVISDQSQKLSQLETDSKTVLAVLTMTNLNPDLYIAAELIDSKFKRHLEMAHCDEIILANDYERKLIVSASSGIGMSQIITELVSSDSESGIYMEEIPTTFIGKSYGEYRDSLKTDAVLIGLLENTGNFHQRRTEALKEAQKTPNIKKIVENLKKIKHLKSNDPVIAPSASYIIKPNSRAIFIMGRGGKNAD